MKRKLLKAILIILIPAVLEQNMGLARQDIFYSLRPMAFEEKDDAAITEKVFEYLSMMDSNGLLKEMGEKAVPHLIANLNNPNSIVCATAEEGLISCAINKIGINKLSGAVPGLVANLTHDLPIIRIHTSVTFSAFAKNRIAVDKLGNAVPALIANLGYNDPNVLISTANTLADFTDNSIATDKLGDAIPALVQSLNHTDRAVRDSMQNAILAFAIKKIAADKLANTCMRMIEYFNHSDPGVRLSAYNILLALADNKIGIMNLSSVAPSLVNAIVNTPQERLTEEPNQKLICALLSRFPTECTPILHQVNLDKLGITVDVLVSTADIFDQLDLTGVNIGSQQLIKGWILRQVLSRKRKEDVLKEAQERTLPLIKVIDYIERDLPSVGLETAEDAPARTEKLAEITTLNYLATIKTQSRIGLSGYYHYGSPTQLVSRPMPSRLTTFTLNTSLLIGFDIDTPLLSYTKAKQPQDYHTCIGGNLGNAALPISIASFLSNDPLEVAYLFSHPQLLYAGTESAAGLPDFWHYIGETVNLVSGQLEPLGQTNLRDGLFLVWPLKDRVIVIYDMDFKRKSFLATCYYAYAKPADKRTEKEKLLANKYEDFLGILENVYKKLGFDINDIGQLLGKGYKIGERESIIAKSRQELSKVTSRLREKITFRAKKFVEEKGYPQGPNEDEAIFAERAMRSYLTEELKINEMISDLLISIEDIYYMDIPRNLVDKIRRLRDNPNELESINIVLMLQSALYSDIPEEERASAAELLGIAGGIEAMNALTHMMDKSPKVKEAINKAMAACI